MGTSTAGLSPDEDALAPTNSSSAAGTALFEKRQPGQLYGSSPFPDDSSNDFDNLEIVSPTLKSKLAVMRVGSDRTDDNLLSVFAGLKNRSGHQLPLEVETVYKDKADQPLSGSQKSWVSITLKPGEETQYRSVALSTDATDFVVRVRSAASDSQP